MYILYPAVRSFVKYVLHVHAHYINAVAEKSVAPSRGAETERRPRAQKPSSGDVNAVVSSPSVG